MHLSTHFHRKLCKIFYKLFNVHIANCDIYSIWHFYPYARLKQIKDVFANSILCRAEWFTIVYWVVLVTSLFGAFYSLAEFLKSYCCYCYCVSTWRQRQYRVLPYKVLRYFRLIGSLVMLNAWLLLFYAVANVSPAHMTPWITINMFLLGFEMLVWIVEVLFGMVKLDGRTVLTFALPLTNLLFVRSVKTVFETAINMNEEEGLRLWKRF